MPLARPSVPAWDSKPCNLRILRERITEVPMIVDAGVGTASMRLWQWNCADGVLMNHGDCRGTRRRAGLPRRCATALPPDAKRFYRAHAEETYASARVRYRRCRVVRFT